MNTISAAKLRPAFGIHTAGNLRPPEMQPAQIPHDRAAHHDVVEVGDHEVGIGDVHVDAEAARNRPVSPPMVNSPIKPKA